MKTIKLVSLVMENFKGFKSKTIDFTDTTVINGMNESGKTSVFDAFTWLLFGKNNENKSKFGVKPQDTDPSSPTYGEEIHYLTTSVTGTFLIDGNKVVLKKQSEEDWRKKQGTDVTLFKGNVVQCFFDELPVNSGVYSTKVSEIVPEETFRLLTDPLFFNGLEWKKRREILFDVIGNFEDGDIIASDEKLKLLNAFIGNHTVEDARTIVKASIANLKKEIKVLPARIDEAKRSITDSVDVLKLDADKLEAEKEINTLQEQLADSSKLDEGKLDAIKELNMKVSDIEMAADSRKRSELSVLHTKICDITDKITETNRTTEGLKRKINSDKSAVNILESRQKETSEKISKLEEEKKALADKWNQAKSDGINAEESVKDMDTTCSLCGQPLQEDKAGDAKQKRIKVIRANAMREMDKCGKEGVNTKNEIDSLSSSFESTAIEIESLKGEVEQSVKELSTYKDTVPALIASADPIKYEQGLINSNDSLTELEKVEIETIKRSIEELRFTETDNSEIKAKIAVYQEAITEINNSLYKQELRTAALVRVEELTEQLKKFGEEVAKLEGQDFLCERFMVAKVELVKSRVKEVFGEVEFKMFEKQINGGLKSTCETMIKGVPYSRANSGHRIASGLIIMKVLSKHYKVSAPIFIDNSESINDWNIPEMDAQTITLYVTTDKELEVK